MPRDASTKPGYDDATVDAVLDALLARLPSRRAPWLVGLSGLQGSGKSTLARQLAAAARQRGVATAVLALDDFYRGRRERETLARTVHPLFATRGVPGTHDIALLAKTLDALKSACPTRVPRFDKGRDTRLPPSRWRRIATSPRLVLLEGWCVGVPPQSTRALRRPVNALERTEDADAHWRATVNAHLGAEYAALWRHFDALVVLAAPSFAIVERWRDEPEQRLRALGAPRAMSPAALRRFLMHYERLSRHALRTLPALADIVVTLDAKRRVRGIRLARQAARSTTTAVP
ncbi:MAG TPA: kinase [Rhodanobacteraceae bacterium]|nr:kinase [Rhodanobacteraceae bacterium]